MDELLVSRIKELEKENKELKNQVEIYRSKINLGGLASKYCTHNLCEIVGELTDDEYHFQNVEKFFTNNMEVLHKKCWKTFAVTLENFIGGERCPHCK